MENRPYVTRLKAAMYVADVSAAYCQALQGCYYKGSMASAVETNGDKVYFLLVNPKESKVNLYVNQVVYANLSGTNLKTVCALCPTPGGVSKAGGMFTSGTNVVNTNTAKMNHQPGGSIYSGRNLTMKNQNAYNDIFTIPSYQTVWSTPAGNLILVPGMCFIIQINPIIEGNVFESAVSFAWWEELEVKG